MPMGPHDSIIQVCRMLHAKGLLAAADGNISVRLNETLLVTPSGSHKGFLQPEDLIECDLSGQVVSGSGRPSTELPMHLLVYRRDSGAKAVIHAHPPTVIGFTLAGKTLDRPILPEMIMTGPRIPTAPYSPPATDRGIKDLAGLIPGHKAIVLDRHGSLTYGRDLIEAVSRLEQLEYLAKTTLIAELLGGPRELSEERQAELIGLGKHLGLL